MAISSSCNIVMTQITVGMFIWSWALKLFFDKAHTKSSPSLGLSGYYTNYFGNGAKSLVYLMETAQICNYLFKKNTCRVLGKKKNRKTSELQRAYDEPSTESSSSLFKANGLASSPLPEPTSLSFSSPPLLISLPSSQVPLCSFFPFSSTRERES